MHDGSRRLRWLLAVGALVALGVALIAPAAAAQEDPPPGWESGSLAVSSTPTQYTATSLSGAFEHRLAPVVSVELVFGTIGDQGEFSDVDGECEPEDRVLDQEQDDDQSSERRFAFSLRGITFPCPGDYSIRATARSSLAGFTITRDLTVTAATAPSPVTQLTAEVDGPNAAPTTTTVEWNDVSGASGGYLVERAGPASGDDFGGYTTVEDVADGSTTAVSDSVEENGRYRYRVLARRSTPDGPLVASKADSATATVSVGGSGDGDGGTGTDDGSSPGLTTPESTAPLDIPGSAGNPSRNPRLDLPSPSTTVDTGFDETLDYGEDGRRRSTTPGDDELAGEGQSVVRTEDEDTGLLGPVAGALVLVGWAGHVAYLNRLAKQF